MIDASHLTKRFADVTAVDDLSFVVKPGVVTGLLGPNGAGKSTTMRMILGLDRPTAGSVTVAGRPYAELTEPLRHVGALLDARSTDRGRSARNHLRWLASTNGIAAARVDDVLGQVGLTHAAHRRTATFSLGMSQRLGLAAALLGDPEVLVLDEPVNGLDTDGIRWVRDLLRTLAAEGRTVLLSSHLMSELEQTADRVLVISGGRLVTETTVDRLLRKRDVTFVRSPERGRLRRALEGTGAQITAADGGWHVSGVSTKVIGDLAARYGVRIHELTPTRSRLEDAYTELIQEG